MKALRLVIFLIVLGGLAWLGIHVFRSEEKPKDEEKEPVTEVAVKTAKLIKTTLHRAVSAFGLVEPTLASQNNPAALAKLAVPSSGLIAEVRCAEGQEVKKGDVLATLDARAAQAKLAQAKKAEEFATQETERQKKLLATDGTSLKTAQEADNALQKARIEVAAAQTEMALLQIEAPISGVVTIVSVRAGEAVSAGAAAVEILDPARLSLTVRLPAGEAAEVKLGQAVELTREGKALPVRGTVDFVSPQVEAINGAVEVRASVPADAGVRKGEWLQCRILGEERREVLAVPIGSVVKDKDDHDVIAVVQGDEAKQKQVKVGVREGSLVEVEGEGLKDGDSVVTVGAYGLPKETKVRVLEETTQPEEKKTAQPAPISTALLKFAQTIPLPNVKGGFDLMAADVAGQRLFVCAEDNHTLEVIDLAAGKPIRSVPGFDEPKWVVYRPETGRLFVATASDGKVTALDATSFKITKEFQFKEKCNNLRFDLVTKELFVGVGKTFGALGIIDTAKDEISSEIKLASFPKQFEIEGNLIYVNVPAANHIAVVDRAKKAVVATWPVTEAKENVPMGFDRAQHRLFVACDPGKFVAFDTATGKSVASLDIAEGADGVHYDAARKLVYVSCGAGVVEVIEQSDPDHYKLVGRVPTAPGAGTSLFVPDFRRLFVLVPQKDKQRAEVRVFGQ